MNEIDELFRDYLRDVPSPAHGTAERLARTAVTAAPRRSIGNPRRHGFGRTAAIAGCIGTTALAAVLGILFIQAPSEPTGAASGPGGWGVRASIRVTPEPGSDVNDATERARQAITARGRRRGIDGLGVEITRSGQLSIVVPQIKLGRGVEDLISFFEPSIYDLDATVVAQGPTIADLIDAPGTSAVPVAGYYVAPRLDGVIAGAMFHSTRDAADDQIRALAPHPVDVLALPEGFRLIIADRGRNPPQSMLVRDTPLVRSGEITGLTARGSRLEIQLSKDADQRIDASVRAGSARLPVSGLWLVENPEGGAAALRPLTITRATDGSVGLAMTTTDAQSHVERFPAPSIGGRLTIESTESYGAEPPLPGTPVADLPQSIDETRTRTVTDRTGNDIGTDEVPRDAIRRVAVATANGHEWALYAGRTAGGMDVVWAMRGNKLIFHNTCDPTPAALTSCFHWSDATSGVLVGRTDTQVATVAAIVARTGAVIAMTGKTGDGRIANGWYLLPVGGALSSEIKIAGAGEDGAPLMTTNPGYSIRVGG